MQTVDIERIRKSEPWDGIQDLPAGRKAVAVKHSVEHVSDAAVVVKAAIVTVLAAPAVAFVIGLFYFALGGK